MSWSLQILSSTRCYHFFGKDPGCCGWGQRFKPPSQQSLFIFFLPNRLILPLEKLCGVALFVDKVDIKTFQYIACVQSNRLSSRQTWVKILPRSQCCLLVGQGQQGHSVVHVSTRIHVSQLPRMLSSVRWNLSCGKEGERYQWGCGFKPPNQPFNFLFWQTKQGNVAKTFKALSWNLWYSS